MRTGNCRHQRLVAAHHEHTLISIIFTQYDPDSFEDDPEVEPDGPVFEVVKVVLDARLYQVEDTNIGQLIHQFLNAQLQ